MNYVTMDHNNFYVAELGFTLGQSHAKYLSVQLLSYLYALVKYCHKKFR